MISKLTAVLTLAVSATALADNVEIAYYPASQLGDSTFAKTDRANVTERTREQLLTGGCLELGTVAIRCVDDRNLTKATLKEARLHGGDLVQLELGEESRTVGEGYGKCLALHEEVGTLVATHDGGFAFPHRLVCDKFEHYRDVTVVVRRATGRVFRCEWDRTRGDYRAAFERQQVALQQEIAWQREAELKEQAEAAEAEARAKADAAEAEAKANAEAAEAEARAKAEAERAAPAIRELTAVIERDPSNRSARMDRAQLFAGIGDEKAAREDYSEILKAYPGDVEALWGRIGVEMREQSFDLLGPDLDELLRVEPTNLEALNHRAWVFQRTSNFLEALRACERVLSLDPENEYAKNLVTVVRNDWRAWLLELAAAGDCERLVQELTRLIEMDPDCAPCYENRAACYRKMGRKDLAEWDEVMKELKEAKKELADTRREIERMKPEENE